MPIYNKVIWSEGMFLQPQHFQQENFYIEQLLHQKMGAVFSYGWGMLQLQLDETLLDVGQIGLNSAAGIFPDGTYFNCPGKDKLPKPLHLKGNDEEEGKLIYLAIPLQQQGKAENMAKETRGISRYLLAQQVCQDINEESGEAGEINVAKLQPHLLMGEAFLHGHSFIPLARIKEINSNHIIKLDNDFLASSLCSGADMNFKNLLHTLYLRLTQRADSMAEGLRQRKAQTAGELSELLMLQAINRYQAMFYQYTQQGSIHPFKVYEIVNTCLAELETFTQKRRRPQLDNPYQHHNLTETFMPLIRRLNEALTATLQQTAKLIVLDKQPRGYWYMLLKKNKVEEKMQLILSAQARVPMEKMQKTFKQHVKISAIEKIKELVSRSLPGVSVHALSVAPRQIPYKINTLYFSLEMQALSEELAESSGLAIHIGGDFPALQLELWGIWEEEHYEE